MPDLKLLLPVCVGLLIVNIIQAYQYEIPSCDTIEQHNTMFAADDPRSFYVCLPDGNPRLVKCDKGSVFVDSQDAYGCAPYYLSSCNKNFKQIDCAGADRDTLVPAEDPANYWICAAPNGVPTELPCPDDKGFVKNATHMGCIAWAGWTC